MHRYGLKLRFKGDRVEDDGIGFYDAATSLQGFAQALQIIARAYYCDEAIDRAMPLKRAALTLSSPRRGSVLFDVEASFDDSPATAPTSSDVFYDYVRFALGKATGDLDVVAQTSYVSRIADDEDLIFDQIAEKVEGSLQRAHRSIDHDVSAVTLERPRSVLIEFNKNTSLWVNTREENPEVMRFTGNVTRYNSKTGNARAYIKELKRIIPVRRSDDFSPAKKGLLTWSLHGDNVSANKDLEFFAKQIESARGDPKRLILTDCNQLRP
ncbi:MAG: hypothetical protein WC804_04355 [Sphingomonas sp.]|jgi:hypothetical protein|uniref:DUF7947 five-stranded beta-barrel domain-containing protein n=1 Tax=Sphingomonas sp. TaxID=28214 RepID=UPI003566CB8F